MICPICGTKAEIEDVLQEDKPQFLESIRDFPVTIYEYWCARGHLLSAISSKTGCWWTVTLHAYEEVEVAVVVFNTKGQIVDVECSQTGRSLWSQ